MGMRVIKLPSEYLDKDESEIENKLLLNNSDIKIEMDTLDIISNIDNDYNRYCAYYIINEILDNNDLYVNNIDTPKSGLEFINRDRKNPNNLGIYHAHLSKGNVLLWYCEKENDEIKVKIKYQKHPKKYEPILKEIYNEPNSYDLSKDDYFKNLKPNTYLRENKLISSFLKFIEKILK